MISDEAHVQALFQAFFPRSASPAEVAKYVGTPYSALVEALNQSPEHVANLAAIAAGKTAVAQLNSTTTQLKSGLYRVA